MNKRTKLLAGLTGYAKRLIDDTWSVVGMRSRPSSAVTQVEASWARVGRHLSEACAHMTRAQHMMGEPQRTRAQVDAAAQAIQEEAPACAWKSAEQDGQREPRELRDGDSIKPRGDQRGSIGFGSAGKR